LTAGAVKAALAWEPKTPGLVNLWCGPSSHSLCFAYTSVAFAGMDEPHLVGTRAARRNLPHLSSEDVASRLREYAVSCSRQLAEPNTSAVHDTLVCVTAGSQTCVTHATHTRTSFSASALTTDGTGGPCTMLSFAYCVSLIASVLRWLYWCWLQQRSHSQQASLQISGHGCCKDASAPQAV